MSERDDVFRDRLVALMTALNGGEGSDQAVRRIVGSYAYRMTKESGATDWTDLKARADAVTYDSMLRIFREQSEKLQQAGDSKGVRGLEALALSLVARHQKQPDLQPGIAFLDRYIEQCAASVKPRSRVAVPSPGPKRASR